MKLKYLLSFLLLSCILSLYAKSKNLEDFLTAADSILWTLKPEQCEILLDSRFKSQDEYDNAVRYHSKESLKYIYFNKKIIPEIIFYFQKRQLQSITVSLYNRGDNGSITEQNFTRLNNEAEKFLRKISGDSNFKKETRKFDDFRIESIKYTGKNCDYVLRRNRKGKYPEYVQLLIYPAGQAKNLRDALQTDAGKNVLQLNLNIEPNGDHYLNIPMVNQGNKGYCVAATVERIMKYYGSRVDQQIIAQLAESDAFQGTNLHKIINVLDKNKSKLQIKVDKLITENIFDSPDDFEKLTMQYNNFAKKQKRNRIKFDDFCKGKGRYRRINVAALISSYEYDLFRSARCKPQRLVDRFNKEVQESLNAGIPLAWCTFTFQNMKDGRRIGNFGLHMRIINGFNPQTNQIIYTDSWGKGHEKKYLALNDAWAITLMLIQITPK